MSDEDDEILRYDLMVERALRAVVRDSLLIAADEGLPGEHHFHITFRTDFPGVEISEQLHSRYAEEMTIVIQHQFWDLAVADDYFAVTLSFSGRPERLVVPYEAVSAFADPAVRFGLQFESLFTGDEDEEAAGPGNDAGEAGSEMPGGEPLPPKVGSDETGEPGSAGEAAEGAEKPGGMDDDKVVTLDSFRKK